MEELLKNVQETFSAFLLDAQKTGNKAAAVRARKASLELEKQLKEYRKTSIK